MKDHPYVLLPVIAIIAFVSACGKEPPPPNTPPFQYRLRQIMIEPSISEKQAQAVRTRAESILKEAKKSNDFTSLAKRYSEEPVAYQTGGDLGFFSHNEMVKPFSDAVFSMKEGEIAGPVESQFGFHIIKLHEIDGDRRHAQHILLMLTPGPEDSTKVVGQLDDIRRRIQDGADFGEMVRQYASIDVIKETEGYMVWQKPQDMLPSFKQAIEGLHTGDISQPFPSILGFHIVMVDSINYNHDAELEGFPAHIEAKLKQSSAVLQ